MRIFDSHTHAYMLPNRDIEMMSLAGIEEVVLCSFVPVAKHAETLLDHFDELCTFQKNRLEDFGIKAHVFVGIHPLCIPNNWERVLKVMADKIESGEAEGIGEVGLHNLNELEERVFFEQLKLAKELDVAVIVHTPPPNLERIKAVKRILNINKNIKVDKLVVDHTSLDTVDLIKDRAIPGLSLKPPLLSAKDVLENLDKFENGLLNSDCANITKTDPLAVPRAVRVLLKSLKEKFVKKLCYENARNTLL